MNKIYLLFSLFISVNVLPLAAQEETGETQKTQGGFWLGGHVSSRGWGMNANYIRSVKNWQLSLGIDAYHVRDSRELRVESIFGDQGRDFVFGKLNYFFVISPTLGIHKDLFKEESGSLIDISVAIQAGPALGFTTPYYIEVAQSIPNSFFERRIVEPFDPERHNYLDIIGRAGIFAENFDPQTEIGFSVRAYTILDLTRIRKYVSGIQAGINVDVFSEAIPILAERADVENQQIFLAFTLGFVIGNRW